MKKFLWRPRPIIGPVWNHGKIVANTALWLFAIAVTIALFFAAHQ